MTFILRDKTVSFCVHQIQDFVWGHGFLGNALSAVLRLGAELEHVYSDVNRGWLIIPLLSLIITLLHLQSNVQLTEPREEESCKQIKAPCSEHILHQQPALPLRKTKAAVYLLATLKHVHLSHAKWQFAGLIYKVLSRLN